MLTFSEVVAYKSTRHSDLDLSNPKLSELLCPGASSKKRGVSCDRLDRAARAPRCRAATAHKSTRHSDLHLRRRRLSQTPLPRRLLEKRERFLRAARSSARQGVTPPPPTPPTHPLDTLTSTSLTPTLATAPSRRLLEKRENMLRARLCRCRAATAHKSSLTLLTFASLSECRVDFVFGDGMTPIEPRARKISGVSRRRYESLGLERLDVRVSGGFVLGGGAQEMFTFSEETPGQRSRETWGERGEGRSAEWMCGR